MGLSCLLHAYRKELRYKESSPDLMQGTATGIGQTNDILYENLNAAGIDAKRGFQTFDLIVNKILKAQLA